MRQRFETELRDRIMRGSYSTAYPWKPADWAEFLRPGGMQFNSERISFYIHIPFCVNLCRFCEGYLI